jgi:hypothetical protein
VSVCRAYYHLGQQIISNPSTFQPTYLKAVLRFTIVESVQLYLTVTLALGGHAGRVGGRGGWGGGGARVGVNQANKSEPIWGFIARRRFRGGGGWVLGVEGRRCLSACSEGTLSCSLTLNTRAQSRDESRAHMCTIV